jgi:protein-L-isoaspartate O-methyltransferase
MKKFNKEEIFKNQINKKEDKTTISKKFKEDIIDFFYKNKNISTKRILEIGCYAGYTTRIFSYIFDEVIAFDNREKVLKIAREFNKDRKNIKFQNFSSYNKKG